jgi:hypothetical protein
LSHIKVFFCIYANAPTFLRINELEGQMECLDDVSPEVFKEFKKLTIDLGQLVT